MQDYIDIAYKNGVVLIDTGKCQFCGADTTRGVHECIEIFSLGFQIMDYSKPDNHFYRFLSVDAHTLQHPEIHGRWNNHFHLTRLHLMLRYQIQWDYMLSPMLSEYLNAYKANKNDEYLVPPKHLNRGNINTTDILNKSFNESDCQLLIMQWAKEVYNSWSNQLEIIDGIASEFKNRNMGLLSVR